MILSHRIAFIFSLLTIAFSAQADQYPGDSAFSRIVQEVYHEISSDRIRLEYDKTIHTRTQLCEKLTRQHNQGLPGQAGQTNAQFIGEVIGVETCLKALWYSKGYSKGSDWAAWAGTLKGTWYSQDGKTFNDPAIWSNPTTQPANNPRDVDKNGQRRVYDFQPVTFSGRTGNARFGWNQSHPDVAYVWGWDPKDNGNQNGRRGAHVGWTFTQGQASCIIWVTPDEAFLECVKPTECGKRRTSAGFFGIGQWEITN